MPGEQRAASCLCGALTLTGLPLSVPSSCSTRHHGIRLPQARTVARPSPSRCAAAGAAAPARCRLLPVTLLVGRLAASGSAIHGCISCKLFCEDKRPYD